MVGDLHCHWGAPFDDNGIPWRIRDLREAMRKLQKHINSRCTDKDEALCVFLGDMYHAVHTTGKVDIRAQSIVLHEIDSLLDNCPALHHKPQCFVHGNHDIVDQKYSAIPSTAPLICSRSPIVVRYGKLDIVLASWQVDNWGHFNPRRWIRELPKGDILCAHAEIQELAKQEGYITQPDRSLSLDGIPDRYKLQLFGHHHKGYQIDDNKWVVGTPYECSFKEEGKENFCLEITEDLQVTKLPMLEQKHVTVLWGDDWEDMSDKYVRVLCREHLTTKVVAKRLSRCRSLKIVHQQVSKMNKIATPLESEPPEKTVERYFMEITTNLDKNKLLDIALQSMKGDV